MYVYLKRKSATTGKAIGVELPISISDLGPGAGTYYGGMVSDDGNGHSYVILNKNNEVPRQLYVTRLISSVTNHLEELETRFSDAIALLTAQESQDSAFDLVEAFCENVTLRAEELLADYDKNAKGVSFVQYMRDSVAAAEAATE